MLLDGTGCGTGAGQQQLLLLLLLRKGTTGDCCGTSGNPLADGQHAH